MLLANLTVASRFPLFCQFDSSLYRQRLNNFPTLPTSRETLNLPANLQQTISGANFLIYSSQGNEILIFGTQENIIKLSTKVHWCVDGTFKSVPHLYRQLFSIHAFEGDKLIPLIYCLLSAKTRVIYSELFRSLKDNASDLKVVLSPELVTCDFESGLIASIRLEFPTASIRGCYFHFCQAVYRKVQVLGLSEFYINEESYRIYIRKLLALAFVPIELIPHTFQGLKYKVFLIVIENPRRKLDFYQKLEFWNCPEVRLLKIVETDLRNIIQIQMIK